LYPGYSISENYISDLGVGPSSIIFNSSVFFLGMLLLFGVYFLKQISEFKCINILILPMGIGAMGVGVFTKDFGTVHHVVSTMTFLFGGLSAITSFKVLKKPFSLTSIILGAMTLGALILFSTGLVTSGLLNSNESIDSFFFLGLGPGGMERMIVYPPLMWLAGFSGQLFTKIEKQTI
jgi:hypothetical membrane protein